MATNPAIIVLVHSLLRNIEQNQPIGKKTPAAKYNVLQKNVLTRARNSL